MITIADLADDLSRSLKSTLHPNEQLLWIGQPNIDVWMKRTRGFSLVISLMAIIAIFMVVQGLDFEPLQSTAIAWGSAFIIISVAIALLDRRFRRQHLNSHLNKIVYALTDQRALCIHANQITSNTSFALRELQIVEKRYNKDGSGDLIFKKETAIDDENDTQIIEHGFIGIVKLDEVEKLIRGSKAEFLLSAHDPQSTSI